MKGLSCDSEHPKVLDQVLSFGNSLMPQLESSCVEILLRQSTFMCCMARVNRIQSASMMLSTGGT